ncbi:MAG: DUF1573 domain-containing protein [Armatimonadetes bacterium]|nr:DUF1573 domain-containing protein [Armatimonadota bacterium]
MVSSLLAMVVVASAGSAEIAPIPSVNSSAGFQRLVATAAKHLEAGKFDAAAGVLKLFPEDVLIYRVDFEGVNAAQRATFEGMVQEVLSSFKRGIPDLEIRPAKRGEIPHLAVSFSEKLPNDEVTGLPKGMVEFDGAGPGDIRFESVIGLRRLSVGTVIESHQFAADFAYSIGATLGFARAPRPGVIMFRTDGVGGRLGPIGLDHRKMHTANRAVVARLKQAVAAKERLIYAVPSAYLGTTSWDAGSVVQGTVSEQRFEIVNRGKAPLTVRVVPDCSCFTLNFPDTIAPGATGLLSVLMNSKDFKGPQRKALFVYTDDPERAVTRIDVTSYVRPVHRVLGGPEGGILEMTENGASSVFYFVMEEDQPVEILSTQVYGLSGVTRVEPWEGMLADPEINEPALPRKGYKISVLLSPSAVKGRVPASVIVETNHPLIPVSSRAFNVQRGVASFPPTLYFGEFKGSAARGYVVLQGLGKPFKITKIETSSPDYSATPETLENGDIKLVLEWKGKSGAGALLGSVTVTTDLPGQPPIVIPIQGISE